MERSGIGCQCGGAPTTLRLPGVVGVRPRPDTEGAQTKPASAMDEHKQTTHQDPLINLLFNDGLQIALPRIAEILMNAAMLLERERHIGAAPYQRGVERNGYANGFKDRTFQTGIGALGLSVPQVRESTTRRGQSSHGNIFLELEDKLFSIGHGKASVVCSTA